MLRIGILSCLTLCVAIVISPGTATSATVTGSASLYTNVFSGATTSTAGTGISVASALSNATDSGGAGARITGTTTNNTGTMIWDRGAGNATTVGTIIALQSSHPAGFLGPMPVEIRLDGNTIISDAGPNDGVMRYQAATLPVGTTAQTLAAYFPNMPTYTGQEPTTFGDIVELAVIPDRLTAIPTAAAGWSTSPGHSIGFGNFSNLVDDDGNGSYVYNGTGAWYVNGGYTNRYFDVDLGTVGSDDLFNVSALLLSTRFDNAQDFDILMSTDGLTFSAIGSGVNVTTTNVAGQNEFFALNFASTFSASHLRFSFADPQPNGNNYAHLLEFLAFEDAPVPPVAPAPEPSTMILAVTGVLALLKRRR